MSLIRIDWSPPRKTLRTFGLIGLVAFGAFGTLAHEQIYPFKSLSTTTGATTAYVLWALAAYCGVFALIAPPAVQPIYLGLTVVTYPIGFVLSYVVMAVLFFLVLTPVAILFKIIGRDSMTRRFDPAATTYWVPRRPAENAKRYFRQF